MALSRDEAMSALRTVIDPELHQDIVKLNMVKDVRIEGDDVFVKVELTTPACPLKEVIEKDVTVALQKAGAASVKIELTANTRGAAGPRKDILPQVKNIIAVGAGKGGVGKSTVAVNLAVGLARAGATVGLMDGDIYGPSMPTMLGLRGATPVAQQGKMIPFFVHGIHAVTIGVIAQEEQPLIWRGPMATGAFRNLLIDKTEWPALDYLIIDLPPGTGDVPLTLCQLLPLTGAVVVATPQQVALDDAIRAVRMFQQLSVAILGIVENMSYVPLPDGTEMDMYGRGGAEKAAARLGLPFLGAIPMYADLRINSDSGKPNDNFEKNPKLAAALTHVVEAVAGQVSIKNLEPAAAELNIS
jgi:ATP-binding protein involved in chromosome partitioning